MKNRLAQAVVTNLVTYVFRLRLLSAGVGLGSRLVAKNFSPIPARVHTETAPLQLHCSPVRRP